MAFFSSGTVGILGGLRGTESMWKTMEKLAQAILVNPCIPHKLG